MDEKIAARQRRREARWAHFTGTVFRVLMAGILLITAAGLLARDRAFSENENRSLAQRPAITAASLADGSWFRDASSYLADQFFGRDRWITLDTFGARLAGRHELNGVYIGAGGQLFSPPEMPDEALLAEKAAAVNDLAARTDRNVMVMLVPGAAAVQVDALPKKAPVRDQLSDITAALETLSPAVTVLDAAGPLLSHTGEYLYYRTDHHWTTDGAYLVFSACADRLCGGAPAPQFQRLTVSEDFEGTLASRAGLHQTRDSITVYLPGDKDAQSYVYLPDTRERSASLYRSAALQTKDQYEVFLGGNHPLAEICTTADTGRCLLVFKDSYANCFVPFLTNAYDRILLIDPRYYYESLSTVEAAYDITDVLFLYSADTWMTDTTLTDVLATG